MKVLHARVAINTFHDPLDKKKAMDEPNAGEIMHFFFLGVSVWLSKKGEMRKIVV